MGRWRSLQQLRDDFKAAGIELGRPTPAGPGSGSCRGKVRHIDQPAALEHIARVQGAGRSYRNGGRWLTDYHCSFCGFWHVGNRKRRTLN